VDGGGGGGRRREGGIRFGVCVRVCGVNEWPWPVSECVCDAAMGL
jgi:hypothetical protein